MMRSWTGAGAGIAAGALALALASPVAAQDEAERLRRQADEIQKVVTEIRGLEFKHEVKKGIQPRDELRKFIQAELAKELPDEKIDALTKAYVKLGFFAPGTNFKQILIDLYAEQVAGFYNPETKELYLIGDQVGAPEETAVLMAHELTHAVQDQNFDLLTMQKAIVDNDDRSLALTSLIEGDATVVMVAYMLRTQLGGGLDVRSLPDIGAMLKFMTKAGDLFGMGGDAMAKAPKVLTENMLFGYVDGASFCQRIVKARAGYEGVSDAFKAPPTSSEQILHPEKYLDPRKRDEPTEVVLPDMAKAFGDGWKLLTKNVMGEFNTELLFREKLSESQAQRAARGWDGDAWQVWEGPKGEITLLWYSVWDSEKDAKEFKDTYASFREKRDGADDRVPYAFMQVDNLVVVVDGGPDPDALLKKLALAETREGYGGAAIARKPEAKPEEPSGKPGLEPAPAPASPFVIRAPEGFEKVEATAKNVVEQWKGPMGAEIRVISSPAASDDIEVVAKRAEAALAEHVPGFELARSQRDRAGNGWRLQFRGEREGQPYQYLQHIVVLGGHQFTAVASAPEAHWDEMRQDLRRAVRVRVAGEAPPAEERPQPREPRRERDPKLY